jgi:hypothetical protein
LLQSQLNYFALKSAEHQAALGATARWRWFGSAMLGLMGLISTLSFCSVLHVRGVPLWLWLAQLAQLTTPFDQPRILLALGVIASTLQGVATMQTQVSLSQRNAERFALLRLRFNRFATEDWPKAKAAALAGDQQAVQQFARRVTDELDDEARAWAEVRGVVGRAQRQPAKSVNRS